ncbi:MAG: proton-conducting transporter membrane subunit [Gammaproteobacteria bacterium]|nr:proton-conducting transporter membrane subunit [Gammaproteobacteria bacterium]
MTHLDLLLLVAFLNLPLAWWLAGGVRRRHFLALPYGLMLGMLLYLDPGATWPSGVSWVFLGQPLSWRLDGLGWFFALPTIGAALAAAAYASGEWGERFVAAGGSSGWLHLALAANVFAMLVLLSAGDLLTLFIGWELVSWVGLPLMVLAGGAAVGAGIRYITYAMGGGMAVLLGVVLVDAWSGSLLPADFMAVLPTLAPWQVGLLVALFFGGFGVKMAMLPFHLWQAPAYGLSVGPAAAFLGAISSRMGLFAMALVLVKFITLERLVDLSIIPGLLDSRDVLAWIAAFTIILPTYTALKQNDARLLLVWHGIGQGGYMVLGLVMGDAFGTAGGLLHVFNYATNQAVLLLAVFAVMHRTGTADLNRMGGLIVRMPLSFLALLIGIIGLAGLPPMNGFVSKWLVYRSLVLEGEPLLFLAAVIGTLGTILSVYKLIHNMFLGQLRVEHEDIREAPWSMTGPMLVLCGIIIVTGTMPGLVLGVVADAQQAIGLAAPDYHLGGVTSPAGGLDMLWLNGVIMAGFAVGAVLFYGFGGRSKRVHQLDNYAGGHFLTADVRYQYSDNFYPGLMHHIGGWYRSSFQWLEGAVISVVDLLATALQGFYRQAQPAAWVLFTITLGFAWAVLP